MAPLKLAKLPDRKTAKITFTVNAELSGLLASYANAYEKEYGQQEAITDLIPHMLEAFIKADRGFRKITDQGRTNSASTSLATNKEL